MTHLESWADVPPQTLVTLRRHAGSPTKAWTASGPFRSDTGVDVIRVDIGGAVVSYPLDRVSLGWTEPKSPAVTIASALAPVPPPPLRWIDAFAFVVVVGSCCYVAGTALAAIASLWLR